MDLHRNRRRIKRKESHLHIRVEQEQLERWRRAAHKDHRLLTHWVTMILDRAAEEAGE